MNMRIAAILLLGYCAGMSTPAFAQKKDKLKKGPNISLNISAKKDSVKTTYLNIGLLTNIYQLKGIGINAVSSVVQNDMTGFQISGLREAGYISPMAYGDAPPDYVTCFICI